MQRIRSESMFTQRFKTPIALLGLAAGALIALSTPPSFGSQSFSDVYCSSAIDSFVRERHNDLGGIGAIFANYNNRMTARMAARIASRSPTQPYRCAETGEMIRPYSSERERDPGARAGAREVSVLSEEEANRLFNEMAAIPYLPFNYSNDGCYARAHEMCRVMELRGVHCGKAFVNAKRYGSRLTFRDRQTGSQGEWGYHVAPYVLVRTATGIERRVIDPSLESRSVTTEQWLRSMGVESHQRENFGVQFTDVSSYQFSFRPAETRRLDEIYERIRSEGRSPDESERGTARQWLNQKSLRTSRLTELLDRARDWNAENPGALERPSSRDFVIRDPTRGGTLLIPPSLLREPSDATLLMAETPEVRPVSRLTCERFYLDIMNEYDFRANRDLRIRNGGSN